jgi:hypothetical protein
VLEIIVYLFFIGRSEFVIDPGKEEGGAVITAAKHLVF